MSLDKINQKKNSILIVDDQPQNIQVMATVLKEKYRIYIANNGMKALKIAKEKGPDLILLDIMMPVMSGLEVCEKLKNSDNTKNIPIIFLTAKADKEDIIKGFGMGAVDYITKPFNQIEVLVRIQNHVELKNARDVLSEKNKELIEINKKLLESEQNLIDKTDDLIETNQQVEEQAFQVNLLNIKLAESEENLKELNAELEDLNNRKDKFFSIIAHDLKNPFTSLLLISEMFNNDIAMFSQDELQSMAKTIYTSSNNLYKLLENLLEWSRIQLSHIDIVPKKFDIHSLAKQCSDILKSMAQQKELKLNISSEITDRSEAFVFADIHMIETVIRNLINNAIKFTERNGKIEVLITKKDESYIRVSIIDNGIGMDEKTLSNLFKIDAKVSSKGTEGEPSAGLGLILCKELAEKNNGKVSVESELKEGTAFHLDIPKAQGVNH